MEAYEAGNNRQSLYTQALSALILEYRAAGRLSGGDALVRRKITPNKAEWKNDCKPLQVLAQEKFEADKTVRRIAEHNAEVAGAVAGCNTKKGTSERLA